MKEASDEPGKLDRLLGNRWLQAASALGVVLGIVGFVLGLPPVSEKIFGRQIAMNLDVVSQIPVFAVRQPVPGLSVTFNGRDLTSERQDLVAARVRLRNSGGVSINERNTTEADPLGFSVSGGHVIRLTEVTATSNHLKRLARPKQDGDSFYLPSRLIIDPSDFIQFDLLIVKPSDGQISFDPLGKIEGLKSIEVNIPISNENNKISDTWSGGLKIQVIRIATYPFIGLALLFILALPFSLLSGWSDTRKRKKREQYASVGRAALKGEGGKLQKLVPLLYISIGRDRLFSLSSSNPFPIPESFAKIILEDQEKYTEEHKPLADFEASEVIEKQLKYDGISSDKIRVLLTRIGFFDKIRDQATDELKRAITKFIEAIDAEFTSDSIANAEPGMESGLPHAIGDDAVPDPWRQARIALAKSNQGIDASLSSDS